MSYAPDRSGCIYLVGFFVAVIALLLGWLSGGAYTETFPRPFNAERWKSTTGNDIDDNTRCGMMADLKYRVGIVGKTRIELAQLLGESHTSQFELGSSDWFLCPSFLDIWVLHVEWDGDRAVSASVHDT